MLYDLSQPTFHNSPHWVEFDPVVVRLIQNVAIDGANVERVDLTTHTGTHLDAPLHFIEGAESVDELPLDHYTGPCLAIDLRGLDHIKIGPIDLEPHLKADIAGTILLLRTGWAQKRACSREFLMHYPYLSKTAAELLVTAGIKGVATESPSIGGFAPGEGQPPHLVLLGAKKLIVEDVTIPDALLDGKRRWFSAFPIKLRGCGGAWTRAVAWDIGDLT